MKVCGCGCGKQLTKGEYARGHYPRVKLTAIERLLEKAEVQEDGCWIWTGTVGENGYGRITFDGVGGIPVHRFAWETLVGPIPPGLEPDHLCLVRACVNPDHLEPVTRRVNTLRSNNPTAVNARKTHCRRHHEFTPENTYMMRGQRRCRQCLAINSHNYAERKKEKK